MKTLWMLIYLTKRFPRYVFGHFISEILTALPQYVANVLFLKYLMEAILEERSLNKMLAIFAGTALFLIVADVYNAWFSHKIKPYEENRIQREFYIEIKTTAEKQDLDVYDNPDFYDQMTYVSEHIFKDTLTLLSHVSKIAASALNIALVINLFYEIGFGIFLIALLSTILSATFEVPVVRLKNRRKYELNRMERKRAYFRDCFLKREYFPELKMTPIASLLHTKYDSTVNEQFSSERQYGIKLFLLNYLRDLLTSTILMNLVLISYLLYEILVSHTLHSSEFIATYNATNMVIGAITEIIVLCGQLAASAYTVEKYRTFISFKSPRKQNTENNWNGINTIEFKHVSFAYPGTDRTVLSNINLRICSGEKIAIVGRNGSGKTTLVHLLMGLYYPTEGEILVNDKLLQQEDYPLYRHHFTAFFQGMKPLEATVAENVSLDTDVDLHKVCLALQRTNCNDIFSDPENTLIGIQFAPTGRILSGGECQRLMLAHCFYSDKSILVMDEPSSALDPVAERDFNLKLAELSGTKLAIFVSHRLSTVHMADHIYVIENGSLCAQGSHDKLMHEQGIYQEMWNIQLEKYGNI